MNRRVFLAGLAITVPVILILGLNLDRNPHQVKSPLIGKPAPDFTLKEVGTGRVVSLDSFKGKPVVVNFWATWCVPCYAEHPVLTQTATSMSSRIQFLGVVYSDSEENIQRFLRENGSVYPSLMDEAGKAAIAYGVYGVPETFFINSAGKIVEKHEGPVTARVMNENLSKVFNGR